MELIQLADRTNDTTNIDDEYVASYLFMHADRHSRPEKDVSIARRKNKKNAEGSADREFPDCFESASNIVNASFRKF